MKDKIQKHFLEIIVVLLSLIFSIWLMFSTFSYFEGQIQIASKAWSDFGSHIPLIRSFSFGDNFPVQFPLFPGPPIKYHFIFYMLVGMLEKSGVRIDYALNILSAAGFFGLLVAIYLLSKTLFASKAVGLLSIIFFLFNGTLSFIYFLKEYPLSTNFLQQIVTNQKFPSFGPYDNGIVSAFWNLNIYTNQRHLALSFALSFLLIFFLLNKAFHKKKLPSHTAILLGILFGLSFYFHQAVFIMTAMILFGLVIFFSHIRLASLIILIIGGILAIPQYLNARSDQLTSSFLINPGYLIADSLTLLNFLKHWFFNLGLHLILMILGFIFAPKNIKKVFLIFLPLFIIGNLFQFSPEIAANHKFFNYFMIIGVMFSAYFLVWMWGKNIFLKPLVLALTFFLIFSGIIDFFPIYNDPKMVIEDYPISQDVRWIIDNTPADTIFLNSSYLYNPESVAGRKVYLGWPYFAWSAGHDTTSRSNKVKQIFTETDKEKICQFLTDDGVDYVVLTQPSEDFPYDPQFWIDNYTPVYQNQTTDLAIYSQTEICQNI